MVGVRRGYRVVAACGATLTSNVACQGSVSETGGIEAGADARKAPPLTDAEAACVAARECCYDSPDDDSPDAGCVAGLAVGDPTLCNLAVNTMPSLVCSSDGTLSEACYQLCAFPSVPTNRPPTGPLSCLSLFPCCSSITVFGGQATCEIIASNGDNYDCLMAIAHLQAEGLCKSIVLPDSGT